MKKFGLKKIYLCFIPIFILVIHMPFVFGVPNVLGNNSFRHPAISPAPAATLAEDNSNLATEAGLKVYDSLQLQSFGLGRQVFEYAMKGFNLMRNTGALTNDAVISIVDFSKPSYRKRLFVIDLKNNKLLFNTYVAHGLQSGKEFASRFSNKLESNKSSLGFYETQDTYIGGNGYSLRLEGIEPGINDNAGKRAIVMHGAQYVDESLIHSQGYIGRSLGCPAVPEKLHRSIIEKIKGGSCLFIYSPDTRYLTRSKLLNDRFATFAFNERKVDSASLKRLLSKSGKS